MSKSKATAKKKNKAKYNSNSPKTSHVPEEKEPTHSL